ncbi:MAG: oligopeptide/dipeptide ABC transporter ATP-binding protein, partial [Abditibacteriaceae bacterium]
AKILDLLKQLRKERSMAILLITHNMALVAEICDRVAVMHQGKIVEMADVFSLFKNPQHPYTRDLLRSMPTLQSVPKQKLATVTWEPTEKQQEQSQLVEASPGHLVSQWVLR